MTMCLSVSLILLVALYTFMCSVKAQAPVFLEQPASINTTEGSKESFTCTANNSFSILYFVDGDPATDPSVINKGFMQLSPIETLDDGSIRATLIVTANSSLNNNSVIKCRGLGSPNADSDEVLLRVQGPLSSVGNLFHNFINSSTATISWSPPFTLPETNITGYNISATSNDISANYFTSNSYYQLVSLCFKVDITISAFNGLDGENTSKELVDSSGLPIYVNGSITDDLHPIVSTNFTDTCNVGVVKSASVKILPDNNSAQTMIVHVDPPETDIKDYDTNITVSEDTNYTIIVSYSIYDGDYTVNGSTSIDTYGVDWLSYTNSTDGNITVTVYFNSFSTDRNCTVEIQNETVIVASAVFNRTGDIAQGNISNVVTGIYTFNAFDEGSDVVAASLEFVTVLGLPEPDSMDHNDPDNGMMNGDGDVTSTPTATTSSTNDTSPTIPTSSLGPPILPTEGGFKIKYVIIIIVVIIIILVTTIGIIIIIYCYYKKKRKGYTNENKRNSSDGLVGSSSFTDRSPTNPPPNMEDMYAKPDKSAKSGHAPVMYAELSGFNKPHSNKVEPTKRQDDRVQYSDLMIKGQPPPPPYEHTEIRETRLLSSATVIRPNQNMSKTTIVNHPDDDIQEIFFHHPNNDASDEGSPPPPPTGSSYPPAPTGRAPSPPEDPNQPPPIPSRHHGGSQHGGNSKLPDVVRQYQNRPDSEEGYNDESLNPTMGTLTEKQDGMFINTPAATYL